MKYKANIIKIGNNAKTMLENKTIILFNQNAPDELKDYCVVTEDTPVRKEIQEGDRLNIFKENYTISSIGEVANQNLHELGHVSLCFDGAKEPKLPGNIHLNTEFKGNILNNTEIFITESN